MTKTTIAENVTVSEGRAETTYVIPSDTTPGSHTIHATYAQNDHYMTSTGYNTAQIRIPTTITVDNVLTSYGEETVFTATVKHHTNQNVDAGTVQFQVESSEDVMVNVGSPVNVVNGVATLTIDEAPSTWKDNGDIQATFIQTNIYGSSTSATATLSIRDEANVSVSDISGNRDTQITITATITDADDSGITSGQAQLYIDNTVSGSAQTVSNGSVSFTYSIADNAVVGSHTIKVVYLQNNEYDSAEGTASLIVRTPTTLTPVNVSGNEGATIPVTVRVTDPNNSAITSGTVNITVGSDSAVQATVGNSGEATIQYQIPSNTMGTTISFSASYVENTNYQGSSTATDGVITVREGTTIVVDSIQAELGDSITLGSTVTDSSSDPVDEGTVTYEIE